MKKLYSLMLLALVGIICSVSSRAANYAWPANYEGVMLQGFYWDSYNDTQWKTLEAQADELSQYFKLIWIPNSAKCASNPSMGYDPVYWFTNYNTRFGTETELRSMIKTYKQKNVGIIADVVINHRSGKSNWTDFPAEVWNGQTWHIGVDGICRDDEVAGQSGQAQPTGAYDTGENFGSARDLDHTNANVQNNCKNYCKFLLDDMGYAGFRLDMTKGYAGRFTKIYNEYSKPTYCVGEYWDGSYDAVAAWIEATGRQSAAFDFPAKYAINEAFHSNDMTKLVWKANGTTDQPAGLIHFGYPQYSVTFVDNHDTYRDGSKFNGNVVAANAFILCSPGTPCVFLPHYQKYKAEIQKLIAVRNAVGVHNCSAVKVLKSSGNCYMAEVTGTKGTLVVKIGSSMDSPSGYTNSDIRASGTDYCVWSKTGNVNPTPTPTPTPSGDPFTVYFKNTSGWATPYIHYWGASQSTWPGVAMTKVDGNVWKYTVPAGTTGILFNAGDGDATKTGDFVAVANHLYSPSGDLGEYNGGNVDPTPTPDPTPGSNFPVYFNNTVGWGTPYIYYWGGSSKPEWPGVAMTKVDGNIWKYEVPDGTTGVIFNAGDGDATKTEDFVAMANHVYTTSGDQGVYNGGNVDPTPDPTPSGDPFNVYFKNTVGWATPYIHYWGASQSTWPGVAMTKVEGDVWKYTVPAGTTGLLFNAGDGDATKTEDFVAVANHIYTTSGDQGVYNGGNVNPTPDPTPGTYPAVLYLVGNYGSYHWDIVSPMSATGDNGVYTFNVTMEAAQDNTMAYFSFVTATSTSNSDWDPVNDSDRYGAAAAGVVLAAGESAPLEIYPVNVSAMGCEAYSIAPGNYTITANLATMTTSVTTASGIDAITVTDEAPVYYNLQGVRVANPGHGLYIRVAGGKAVKVAL